MLKAILFHIKDVSLNHCSVPHLDILIEDGLVNNILFGYTDIISSEDLQMNPFLAEARNLDVLPAECLVITDSDKGTRFASDAKISCIGYCNPNNPNQKLNQVSMLLEGFDEVDFTFINRYYQHDHMEPVTILTTDHFIIREMTVEDIDDLYQIYQTPVVKAYLPDMEDNIAIEKDKHLAYIKNVYQFYGFGLWGVFLRSNHKLIGRCGIEYKNFDNDDIYEIGYLLDVQYHGLGYAKEFVSAVIQYSFNCLNIPKITAIIDRNNYRSIHLAERVGLIRIRNCIIDRKNCYIYQIFNKK